jgi:hypothetical protein
MHGFKLLRTGLDMIATLFGYPPTMSGELSGRLLG